MFFRARLDRLNYPIEKRSLPQPLFTFLGRGLERFMLTQERLKEVLHYAFDAGVFHWLVKRGSRAAGAPAGATDAYGYTVIRIDKRLYKAHQLAWLYQYGYFPDGNLDHIDRNKANNAIDNLRIVNQSENMQNQTRSRGVYLDKARNKWCARLKVNYKNIFLGRFDLYEDALSAYAAAAAIYHTHNPVVSK